MDSENDNLLSKVNVEFPATVPHIINSAVPNDKFHICDRKDSDYHSHTNSRGSHPDSQDTQAKEFNRLKAELAAAKRQKENLCHALETKSKLSKSLDGNLEKLKLQVEHLSAVERNFSSESTKLLSKASEERLFNNRRKNSNEIELLM